MKFAKLPRNVFSVTKYNPGPGQYNNECLGQTLRVGKSYLGGAALFSREERFDGQPDKKEKIGPGSYKAEASDFEKIFQQKTQGVGLGKANSLTGTQESSQVVRINAVPSIPSKNVNQGYQEIGNGLLIVIKDEEEKDGVGPATYKPKYDYSKPRIPNHIIKLPAPHIRKKPFESELTKIEQENVQQQPLPPTLPMSKIRSQSAINQNLQTSRFVSELVRLMGKDYKKENIGEQNLELLMIRDRQLSKNDRAPAPGKYYNEQNQTSFRIAQKAPEFQCFDSSQQRFEDNIAFKNATAPGQYTHQPKWNTLGGKGGQKFNRDRRSLSAFNTQNMAEKVPGPGDYNTNLLDLSNLDKYALYKLKQDSIPFNSVFGSGTRRFVEEKIESMPGPGSYNLRPKRSKKVRKVQILQVPKSSDAFDVNQIQKQSDLPPQSNAVIDKRMRSVSNQCFHKIEGANQQRMHVPKQTHSSQGGSHIKESFQFKSKSDRFNNYDHIQNSQNLVDLGPGCYEISQNISKPTLNKSGDLIYKSERVKEHPSDPLKGRIGPAYYDPSLNTVKTNLVCASLF